jgi:hypothetical protein
VLLLGATLGTLGATSASAEHRIKKLGYPSTSFHKPALKKADDARRLLRGKKAADVLTVLQKGGYTGTAEDLDRAAQGGEIVEITIAPETRIPFMALRRKGKPDIVTDVVWAGTKHFEAFELRFSSNGTDWRLVIPKPCGNVWIEGSTPPPPPIVRNPKVALTPGGEVCVTQPASVTVTVEDPAPGSNVVLAVNGQNVATFPATAGSVQKQIPAQNTPGSYTVTASLEGAAAAGKGNVIVKPCPPTCALVVTPNPVRSGKPFTVDASGSRVAPNVAGGIKSAQVDIVRKKDGVKVDSFVLAGPALRRDDVVIRKGGDYKISVVVTDDAGQTSSNTCEVDPFTVKPSLPVFGAAFFGKERLIQDDFLGGRCAPLFGAEIGLLPEIAENVELQASLGAKINTRDGGNSSMFADVAINRVLNRGFIGGGVSLWDITESDTRALAALVQGGVDVSKDGRFQFVVEGRLPFDQFDDVSNNYQFWGGIRLRPARR